MLATIFQLSIAHRSWQPLYQIPSRSRPQVVFTSLLLAGMLEQDSRPDVLCASRRPLTSVSPKHLSSGEDCQVTISLDTLRMQRKVCLRSSDRYVSMHCREFGMRSVVRRKALFLNTQTTKSCFTVGRSLSSDLDRANLDLQTSH
jgi:hypothetical protein